MVLFSKSFHRSIYSFSLCAAQHRHVADGYRASLLTECAVLLVDALRAQFMWIAQWFYYRRVLGDGIATVH